METKQNALVVYESMFGNTHAIAEAIADGISPHLAVEIRDAASAPDPHDHALIVAGGPTHAFSLSRPSTRADATRQGATGSTDTGLREWLEMLPRADQGPRFAAFDTRVSSVRHLPGSAARAAARRARARGYQVIGSESFWVAGTPGPLVTGEIDRAREWGRRLGTVVLEKYAAATAEGRR